jgi:hypothetical protein
MKHFTEDDSKGILAILAMVLMFPLAGANMWLLYECWGAPKYWKNRWRLHRLLKKGKARILGCSEWPRNVRGPHAICRYDIDIEGQRYMLDIWNGTEMTLQGEGLYGERYIGLFKASLIARFLNRKAIQSIEDMADMQKNRDRQLERLGI